MDKEKELCKNYIGLLDSKLQQTGIIMFKEVWKEAQKEALKETYDYLYDNLPVGKLDAFDLVKIRKRELDYISKQIETLSLK